MFGLLKKAKAAATEIPTPDPSKVVPRIKHTDFVAAYRGQNEASPGGQPFPGGQMPVTRPLADDLIVSYAIETPTSFIFVSEDSMAEMDLDAAALHERALKNLRPQLQGHLEIQAADNFYGLAAPDGLAACSLLLPDFWEQLANRLGSDLSVAVPGREYVCFNPVPPAGAPAEDKGKHLARMKVMKGASISAWNESGNHSLSQWIFAWKGRKWEPVERLEEGI